MKSRWEAAYTQLRRIVGPEGVVEDGPDAQALLRDARGLFRGRAALVLRPASTQQVARVLAVCNQAGIGVVPQGGNTGYCAGATPDTSGRQVLLSMSRLNRVRDVDITGMTMTVEAGAVLARVQQAAAQSGLFFPLSMGSEGSCQIGGNLATNAGGLAVLRYGTCRELALGIEVVLPDGRVISDLKGLRKDNTGFDLKQLFIGAEGTLGVITAAVLKLFPPPTETRTAWLAVAAPDAACRLLRRARGASGDAVTSFEYVSRASLELALQFLEGAFDPLDRPYPHYALLEMSAALPEGSLRGAMEGVLEQGMEAGEVLDGVVAESGPQRSALWRLREGIPEAERLAGGSVKHDVSVRISRIDEFLRRAVEAVERMAPCRVSAYGHLGDGNVHFNLLAPDGLDADEFRRRSGAALSAAVHELASQMKGSFSAEHGIGRLKREELERFKQAEALTVMRSIKHALDPNGIMNPGKVLSLPELSEDDPGATTCAEAPSR